MIHLCSLFKKSIVTWPILDAKDVCSFGIPNGPQHGRLRTVEQGRTKVLLRSGAHAGRHTDKICLATRT